MQAQTAGQTQSRRSASVEKYVRRIKPRTAQATLLGSWHPGAASVIEPPTLPRQPSKRLGITYLQHRAIPQPTRKTAPGK